MTEYEQSMTTNNKFVNIRTIMDVDIYCVQTCSSLRTSERPGNISSPSHPDDTKYCWITQCHKCSPYSPSTEEHEFVESLFFFFTEQNTIT